MDIQVEKLAIINHIIGLNDDLMLQTIRNLLSIGKTTPEATTDFWDELTPGQKESVRISLEQFENGEIIDNEIVMSEMKKRFAQ
jgi:hypothetical protein